jgi:hypothetical protein
MWLRRKKTPKEAYPTTAEGFLGLDGKLSDRQRNLFGLLQKKARKELEQAQALLAEHDAAPLTPIPLDRQAAIINQWGYQRALSGLILVGGPVTAVGLMTFHHPLAGLLVLIGGLSGLVGLRAWGTYQRARMALDPLERKALMARAAPDAHARSVAVRWRKEQRVLVQRDLDDIERWRSAQDALQRWAQAEHLAKPPARVPRRWGRG